MNKIFTHAFVFFLLLVPLSIHAADGKLENPLAYNTLYDFLQGILRVVIMIGFPIIVLFIVYIGFRFVQLSATGGELKEVKKNLWYAIIGAMVLLGAQALSFAIQNTVEGLTRGIR